MLLLWTFKLEGLPGNVTEIVSTSGSIPGSWETLTFDFTGRTGGGTVSAVSIFFDNGLPGMADTDAPNWTFYVDDIELSGGGGGPGGGELVPDGGFEVAGAGSGLVAPWLTDPNGGTVGVSNVDANGGTYSARMQADASAGTSFPILKVEQVGSGDVTAGGTVTVSFDARDADTTGIGKVFVAEFFSERADPPGGATNEVLLQGGYALTNTWQTFTYHTHPGCRRYKGCVATIQGRLRSKSRLYHGCLH